MKYNFVIFQVQHDYYKISMQDVLSLHHVKYLNKYPYFGGSIFNFIHRLHFSGKILKYISLPFKSIWNPFYFKNSFTDNKPICFIFSGATAIWAKSGFVRYLKSKYPNSRCICFYQDVVESYKYITINEIKQYFDLVITYNHDDANKYNILYHPTQYSLIKIPVNNNIKTSDVYFIGAAKNRLDSIYKAYEYFNEMGMVCDFNITGVKKRDRKYCESIRFIKHMPYIENLQHIDKTKAILEITQDGSTGYTLRMWEAIGYKKFLITDNSIINTISDSSNGFVFLYSSNIDLKHKLFQQVHYDPKWYKLMSVNTFLDFLEKNI